MREGGRGRCGEEDKVRKEAKVCKLGFCAFKQRKETIRMRMSETDLSPPDVSLTRRPLTLIFNLLVVWTRLWSMIKNPAVVRGEKWGRRR